MWGWDWVGGGECMCIYVCLCTLTPTHTNTHKHTHTRDIHIYTYIHILYYILTPGVLLLAMVCFRLRKPKTNIIYILTLTKPRGFVIGVGLLYIVRCRCAGLWSSGAQGYFFFVPRQYSISLFLVLSANK